MANAKLQRTKSYQGQPVRFQTKPLRPPNILNDIAFGFNSEEAKVLLLLIWIWR